MNSKQWTAINFEAPEFSQLDSDECRQGLTAVYETAVAGLSKLEGSMGPVYGRYSTIATMMNEQQPDWTEDGRF